MIRWLLDGIALLCCLLLIPIVAGLVGFAGYIQSRDFGHGIPFGMAFGSVGAVIGYIFASWMADKLDLWGAPSID